jgi:hypothetical protein
MFDSTSVVARTLRPLVFLAVFAAGYVCGTLHREPAGAQFKELGQGAMKEAAQGGGALGGVMELGTAIVDMQQHVDGLQKNIDVLKKVKAGLGG